MTTANDLSQNDKYCVFECASDLFAIPALQVHRVQPRPKLTMVPCSPGVLAGMAHTHQDFLPVVDLARSLDSARACDASNPQLIVLKHDLGVWGLLVDKVKTLAELDVAQNGLQSQSGSNQFVSGSATLDNEFVRTLQVDRLFAEVSDALNEYWNDLAYASNPLN